MRRSLFLSILLVAAAAGLAEAGFTPKPGQLKQISVGSAKHIWGIASNGSIYRWNGSGFSGVSGQLKHIAVGADGSVFGIDPRGTPLQWVNGGWKSLGGQLEVIAAGSSSQVWGLARGGQIYRRQNNGWHPQPGGLQSIGVGSDGTVFGVNNVGNIYRRNARGGLDLISGQLQQISVGSSKHVWGIARGGGIYRWTGSGFSPVAGQLAQVSVGADGECWGVAFGGGVYRFEEAGRPKPKPQPRPGPRGKKVFAINVSPAKIRCAPGEVVPLTAVAVDRRGKPVKRARLEFRPTGGTVEGNRFCAGNRPGKFQIWINHKGSGVSRVVDVRIVPRVTCKRIVITPANAVCYTGQQVSLAAIAYDQYNRPIKVPLDWACSSGGRVANGIFYAPNRPGQYTISCRYGPASVAAQCVITVREQLVCKRIVITPGDATCYAGQQIRLSAVSYDQHGRPFSVPLEWGVSSGGRVQDGIFYAPNQPGRYEVWCRYSKHNAASRCIITVQERLVCKRIVITPGNASCYTGQQVRLSAAAFDQHGRPYQVPLQWSCANGGRVQDGIFYAPNQPGTYEVWCRYPVTNAAAVCRITVQEPVQLSIITAKNPVVRIQRGGKLQIELEGFDQYNRPCKIPVQALRGAATKGRLFIQRCLWVAPRRQVGHYRIEVYAEGYGPKCRTWIDVYVY